MGDRISIQFVKDADQSPVFFSHWQGTSLLNDVESYLDEPLDRLEPRTVMVDFIRWMAERELTGAHIKRHRITSNFYLGKDSEDGDNSDNGHVEIDLNDRDHSYLHYCNCGNPNCEIG